MEFLRNFNIPFLSVKKKKKKKRNEMKKEKGEDLVTSNFYSRSFSLFPNFELDRTDPLQRS